MIYSITINRYFQLADRKDRYWPVKSFLLDNHGRIYLRNPINAETYRQGNDERNAKEHARIEADTHVDEDGVHLTEFLGQYRNDGDGQYECHHQQRRER